MHTISYIFHNLVVAQAPGPSGSDTGTSQLLFFGLFFAAMYFLLIAPQRKKQKQHDEMLKSFKGGEKVLTSGGIYGQIVNVKGDRFVVRIAEGTKIEIGKNFVHSRVDALPAENKAEARPQQ